MLFEQLKNLSKNKVIKILILFHYKYAYQHFIKYKKKQCKSHTD